MFFSLTAFLGTLKLLLGKSHGQPTIEESGIHTEIMVLLYKAPICALLYVNVVEDLRYRRP